MTKIQLFQKITAFTILVGFLFTNNAYPLSVNSALRPPLMTARSTASVQRVQGKSTLASSQRVMAKALLSDRQFLEVIDKLRDLLRHIKYIKVWETETTIQTIKIERELTDLCTALRRSIETAFKGHLPRLIMADLSAINLDLLENSRTITTYRVFSSTLEDTMNASLDGLVAHLKQIAHIGRRPKKSEELFTEIETIRREMPGYQPNAGLESYKAGLDRLKEIALDPSVPEQVSDAAINALKNIGETYFNWGNKIGNTVHDIAQNTFIEALIQRITEQFLTNIFDKKMKLEKASRNALDKLRQFGDDTHVGQIMYGYRGERDVLVMLLTRIFYSSLRRQASAEIEGLRGAAPEIRAPSLPVSRPMPTATGL